MISRSHRPLLDRYEIKYAVSESLVPAIRQYMLPYMLYDPFSDGGASYPISSVYLDTRDHRFARETDEGLKRRFKMRIRAYDDKPESKVFCEIKHREGDVVKKSRVAIQRQMLTKVVRASCSSADLGDLKERDLAALADFQTRISRFAVLPSFVVRYDREAYESARGEQLRITFDRNLRWVPAAAAEIPVHKANWRSVRWHRDPSTLVLEIKFNGTSPAWIHQMIRHLEIRQRGVGKYALSVRDAKSSNPPWVHAYQGSG